MVLRAKVRFPASDIWDAPEDGNRYEVIDGALFVTPPPSFWHQNAIAELLTYLLPHVHEHGLGKVIPAPVGVVLSDDDGVEPDIVYVSRERLGIITDRGIEGAPDLVVEVLSPSTRHTDLKDKLDEYARAGVGEYWIVDPDERWIEVHALSGKRYRRAMRVSAGGEASSTVLTGFTILADTLFSA